MNHNNEQHGMENLKLIPSQLLKGSKIVDLGIEHKKFTLVNQHIPYL